MPDNSEHAPPSRPAPTLGLPRESGWKMELRKKKSRACTEQAIGFPTYVPVHTATATAGESGEIKGFFKSSTVGIGLHLCLGDRHQQRGGKHAGGTAHRACGRVDPWGRAGL